MRVSVFSKSHRMEKMLVTDVCTQKISVAGNFMGMVKLAQNVRHVIQS